MARRFVTVTRELLRDEWAARARVFSSAVPAGANVEFMQWFRAARSPTAADPRAHAAEHRFRIGPKGTLQSALPVGFGVTSLVVIERLPDNSAYDFRVQNHCAGRAWYLGLFPLSYPPSTSPPLRLWA